MHSNSKHQKGVLYFGGDALYSSSVVGGVPLLEESERIHYSSLKTTHAHSYYSVEQSK